MKIKVTAAIIALALIAIITVLVTGRTSTATSEPHHTSAKGCDAGPADDTMPTTSPASFEWKNLGAITVPVSTTYGPTKYDGDLWTCYRHDPMGAVFAAYDILAAAVSPQWRQVADAQFVPGTGQQAYIAAGEQQTIPPMQPGQVVQPVGFQVSSYTPAQATVVVLSTSGGTDQYQADERTVAWEDGDWKLVVSPDGSTGPDPQLVSSTSGFILWGGDNG
jgi:hypothetical protein